VVVRDQPGAVAPAKAKPCKGMAGLVEEGDEVIEEGKELDDAGGRSRYDRRRAEGGALRDLGLRHGEDDGRAGEAASRRRPVEQRRWPRKKSPTIC
jgi:hypothetical protein